MYKNRTDKAILYYTCYKYKPHPVIRSMYELTFTFRLADLVRYEVHSKQRSDHPLVIQCLVTERLVTERSHYKFPRITKRSMYDTYVRNDNVNALTDSQSSSFFLLFAALQLNYATIMKQLNFGVLKNSRNMKWSVECQKGVIAVQRCSIEHHKGSIAVQSL